jgi:uncharacterized protein (TIGR00290 family)
MLSWSTGKDACWALYRLRQDPSIEVVGLLTTGTETFNRTSMHGVRREMLQAQAKAVGLPVEEVLLPWPCTNEEYESRMAVLIERVREVYAIDAMAFGDLFLEDVRDYRIAKMAGTGIEPIFPLWGTPTPVLAREMIAGGLRAKLSCVNSKVISADFAGREFDESLLNDLPEGIDPCAENGEFHTCVYDAPVFSAPISVTVGEIVDRDGFVYADIVPSPSNSSVV